MTRHFLAHPQLLDALAKAAPQHRVEHGVVLQLAIHVVARLGVQPADAADQLR